MQILDSKQRSDGEKSRAQEESESGKEKNIQREPKQLEEQFWETK